MLRSTRISSFQKAKTAHQISNKIGSHTYNQRAETLKSTIFKGFGVCGKDFSTKNNLGVITCKGAVCWGQGEPVRVEEIQVEPPRSTEVRLKMSYASLCHTDILGCHGIFGPFFPRVLGHEGVGVVESVGDQVTDFKEGDVVIPTFLGECHMCDNCVSGKTNVCTTHPMPISGLMPDGTSRMSTAKSSTMLYQLFSCSTWAEYAVIDVDYAVKVTENRLPLPHASLLSCGFSTGFGGPWKSAKVEKGSSVAVIGLGAVGLGAVEGARLQEASRIIGIDKNVRKGAKGKVFRMTDFINPGDSNKPVSDLVKEMTGGMGVDYCIECTGAFPLAQQALESTKPGTGTTIMIGAGSKPSTEIDYLTMLMGRTLKGSVFGGIKVKSELPTLMDNCVRKGIQLDELVTHEIALDDVGKAFDMLKEPDCVKVLVKI